MTKVSSPTLKQYLKGYGAGAFAQVGRKVWIFGGAHLVGPLLSSVSHIWSVDLDTLETTYMEQPPSVSNWPDQRFAACAMPYKDSMVVYGGYFDLFDSGGFAQIWLLNTSITDPAKMWRQVLPPDDSVKIPKPTLWPGCTSRNGELFMYSGARGFNLMTLVTSGATAGYDLRVESLKILRMDKDDSSKFSFIIPSSDTLWGSWTPQRLGSSAFLHPDGHTLNVFGGWSFDSAADTSAGGLYSDWDFTWIRFGCGEGQEGIYADDTDLFSFKCRQCSAGTVQLQGYLSTNPSNTTRRCADCPPGQEKHWHHVRILIVSV